MNKVTVLHAQTTSQDRYGDDFGGEQMWGLQELPLPEAIAYGPQTIGWLVVAAALGVLVVGWLWRRGQVWRDDAWRRSARDALDEMAADPRRTKELPSLLRRCALHVAPRDSVASLRGSEWIGWLNKRAGRALFAPEDAERLDRLAYAPDDGRLPVEHCQRLLDCGRQWLRLEHD